MADQNNSNPRKRPREEERKPQRPLPAVPTYSQSSSAWELPAQTAYGAQQGQLISSEQYAQSSYGNQPARPGHTSQQAQPTYRYWQGRTPGGYVPAETTYSYQQTQPVCGMQPARPSYNSQQTQPTVGYLQGQTPHGSLSAATSYGYQQTQPIYGMQPPADNNIALSACGNQQAQPTNDTSVEHAFSGSLWDDVIGSAEANHRRRLEIAKNDPAAHQRALDRFRHSQPGPVLTDAQQRAVEARERLESLRHTWGNDQLSHELREVSVTMRRINELRDSGELEFSDDESSDEQGTVANSIYQGAMRSNQGSDVRGRTRIRGRGAGFSRQR